MRRKKKLDEKKKKKNRSRKQKYVYIILFGCEFYFASALDFTLLYGY